MSKCHLRRYGRSGWGRLAQHGSVGALRRHFWRSCGDRSRIDPRSIQILEITPAHQPPTPRVQPVYRPALDPSQNQGPQASSSRLCDWSAWGNKPVMHQCAHRFPRRGGRRGGAERRGGEGRRGLPRRRITGSRKTSTHYSASSSPSEYGITAELYRILCGVRRSRPVHTSARPSEMSQSSLV